MIANRIARGIESRDFTLQDVPQSIQEYWAGGSASYSGETVSVASSLGLIPVFAAVQAIASAIGVMPCHVYRRLDRGRERATGTWQYRLLHESPNSEMAPGQFFETVTVHMLMWGNCYIEKQKGTFAGAPRVMELHPIQPSRVHVTRDSEGRKVFEVEGNSASFYENTVLHIPGMGYDGTSGLSPIANARQEIGGAQARQKVQGAFYKRGAHISGVIKRPKDAPKWSPEAFDKFKAAWRTWYEGASGDYVGGTPVLQDGMEFQNVGMPFRDQQFIEQGQFTTTQIATLFNLPASKINGQTGDGLTYGTREQDATEFVQTTLLPWMTRITQGLWRDTDLFPSRTFYPDLLSEALLRGDAKSRLEFYEGMNRLKVLSSNDIAELEDRPVREDGDEFPKTAEPGGAGSDVSTQAG